MTHPDSDCCSYSRPAFLSFLLSLSIASLFFWSCSPSPFFSNSVQRDFFVHLQLCCLCRPCTPEFTGTLDRWYLFISVGSIAHLIDDVCFCRRAGVAQWLERRTRDRKVAGSNPCWSGGRIFFSRVNFLCWLLFRYPFHPLVTAVARKRPRLSAKSAGGRLPLNTHTPYVCGFAWSYMVHGCMVYTERAEMAAVSCGTSHASAVSTPLRWIFKKKKKKKKKRAIKNYSLMQNHMRAQWVCSRAENSAI